MAENPLEDLRRQMAAAMPVMTKELCEKYGYNYPEEGGTSEQEDAMLGVIAGVENNSGNVWASHAPGNPSGWECKLCRATFPHAKPRERNPVIAHDRLHIEALQHLRPGVWEAFLSLVVLSHATSMDQMMDCARQVLG